MDDLEKVLTASRLSLISPDRGSMYFDLPFLRKAILLSQTENPDGDGPWKFSSLDSKKAATTLKSWCSREEGHLELALCYRFVRYTEPTTKRTNEAPTAIRPVRYDAKNKVIVAAGPVTENRILRDYFASNSLTWPDSAGSPTIQSQGPTFVRPDRTCVVEYEYTRRSLASSVDIELHPQILSAPAALRMCTIRPNGPSKPQRSMTSTSVASSVALNRDQRRAVEHASMEEATIIEGPPGTGKTQTICSIVEAACIQGYRVLITSTEETALDVTRRRLRQFELLDSRLITIGTPSHIARNEDPPQADGRYELVVIDEASRMPFLTAISMLCRANRAVIIGDKRQMTPEGNARSILDAAYAALIPSTTLSSHYRSVHPALISISNIMAYDMRLKTVPRPEMSSIHGLGVTWSLESMTEVVNGGVINNAEALGIIEYVKSHIRRADQRTIAIIAANRQQTTLIRQLIANEIAIPDALKRHWDAEPLIVRTTSHIQGEERDIVLISTVYTPRSGDKRQRFGVFEEERCIERVNVMLSRARSYMHLFASFTSEDLLQPMSQGALALTTVIRGFETLTAGDLRQEPPASVISICRSLDVEVDHLGVVFGIRRRGSSRYCIGLVIPDKRKTEADHKDLVDQLLGFGWRIVSFTAEQLTAKRTECHSMIAEFMGKPN